MAVSAPARRLSTLRRSGPMPCEHGASPDHLGKWADGRPRDPCPPSGRAREAGERDAGAGLQPNVHPARPAPRQAGGREACTVSGALHRECGEIAFLAAEFHTGRFKARFLPRGWRRRADHPQMSGGGRLVRRSRPSATPCPPRIGIPHSAAPPSATLRFDQPRPTGSVLPRTRGSTPPEDRRSKRLQPATRRISTFMPTASA